MAGGRMSKASNNSPSLAEVISMGVDFHLMQVNTMMPGIVQSYDASTQTAMVQPAIMKVYEEGGAQELPQVKALVHFPATQTAWVKLPLAQGDRGMLIFAQRSLDEWWASGGVVDPGDTVKFSMNDAVFVPGLNDKSNAITPKGAANSMEIAYGNLWVELTAAGLCRVKNSSTDLYTVLNNILSHLQALTTTNCVVGSPVALNPATVAQLVADQLALGEILSP